MNLSDALLAHVTALTAHKERQKEQTALGQILDRVQRDYEEAVDRATKAFSLLAGSQRDLNRALLEEQIQAGRQ